MKRILSILLSMTIVASLLVSMSVTSFAIDWTVKDNWNVLPENGTVTTIVTNVTDTEEADMFAQNTLGEETFEAMKAYYPTDVYVFKIRQEITDLPLWTAKNGSKYYGLWLSGIAANYEFDINNMAYSEDIEEYFFYQSEENFKYANFLAADLTDQGGFYLVGMTEDLTANTFKALPPMNNELAEYPVGNGRGDYVLEFYVITNTDTFDFNVCNLYYTTYELTSEEAQLNTKKPNSISVGSNTKKCLEQKVFSVVDGELVEEEEEVTYTITFVVEGQADVEITVAEGELPVFPGTPAKDGYTFEGWDKPIVEATEDATYTAVFEEIVIPDAVEVTNVAANNKNVFPGTTSPTTTVMVGESEVELDITKLHRVDTTFNYTGTLVEMGMLFIPKAVADKNNLTTAQNIADSGLAADANCSELPEDITGVNTNVTFKAGLYNVPEAVKGKDIIAVPYYTLSGGTRQYYNTIVTTF